jgi:hypothetical protein
MISAFLLAGSFVGLGGGEISEFETLPELIADSKPDGKQMNRVRQTIGKMAVRIMVERILGNPGD